MRKQVGQKLTCFFFNMQMTSIAFEEKLKKVNPALYIDKDNVTFETNKELGSSGIYCKGLNREKINLFGLDWQDRRAAEKYNDTDEYITWATKHVVYEYDQFDEQGKCIGLGWRTIVKNLIKSKVADYKKCRKVFGWEESDYDRLSYEEKRALCQQQRTDIPVMNL